MKYIIEYQLDCLLVDYDKLKRQVFDDKSSVSYSDTSFGSKDAV